MATRTELMAAGIPSLPAQMLGSQASTALAAAGTTQGTATAIMDGVSAFTTVAANSGAVLPTASGRALSVVYNGGANTLTVYPAVGESFYGQSANAGVPVVVGKSAMFSPNGNAWAVNFSA